MGEEATQFIAKMSPGKREDPVGAAMWKKERKVSVRNLFYKKKFMKFLFYNSL